MNGTALSGHNFYKESYVVPWQKFGPWDELCVTLLSLCVVMFFVLLFVLLYAYNEVKDEPCRAHHTKMIVIYMHTIIAFIVFYISLLSMSQVKETQMKKGWSLTISLLLSILAAVIWLMVEPLSAAITVTSRKQRRGLFFVAIGWGLAILILLMYVGLHYILKEQLIDVTLCWFYSSSPVVFEVLPLSSILTVHLMTALIANLCRRKRKSKSDPKNLIVRCATLNMLMILPTYISLGMYHLLARNYNILYEYIFCTLLTVQCTAMLLGYLVFNPLVKDSLVDLGRKTFEMNKVNEPRIGSRAIFHS